MTFEDYINHYAVESRDADYDALAMSKCWNNAIKEAMIEIQKLRKDNVYVGYDEGWDDALDIAEQAIWGLMDK